MTPNTTRIELNDSWLMIDGNTRDDPAFHKNGIQKDGAIPVTLPCLTNMYIEDHVGVSWYERTFTLQSAPADTETALLCFEMAEFRTEASVNGVIVGTHVGVEDSFSFDVTDALREGENRVTVRVSKPHDIDVDGYTFGEIPHRNQSPHGMNPGACYNTSGLCGEVSLLIVPKVRIADLSVTGEYETAGTLKANVVLINETDSSTDATLILEARRSPDGTVEETYSVPVTIYSGEMGMEVNLTVANPRLWSVDDPNLYEVRAELITDIGTSTAVRRTGFRTFRVGGDGYFYLNGKRIYPKSSHTGNCMPESTHHISADKELLRKDFLLAKAAGFNMIRFISGVALPLQLDLCDEIGMMIYEEPLDSWLGQNGPHAVELYRQDLFTMVRRDRSHPCVVIWGLLNETFAHEPWEQVCYAARDALPDLRKIDDTRLVLYSSGRWDRKLSMGSVSNPHSDVWEPLWGNEGQDGEGECGDIHYYPTRVPLDAANIEHMRGFGKGQPKPVFVSESGVGSAFDTITLLGQYEQKNAVPLAPDVKAVKDINEKFLAQFEKYGFTDDIPFPSEMFRASYKNHAYYRTQAFDQLRGNPNVCGINITGLLDHSVCGEGLWTLYREYKPMMADVLQDGFAKLRWNVFLSSPAIFEGAPLTVEASIASEDILPVGGEYDVRAGIIGDSGESHGVKTFHITVTEDAARHMVIPVFTDTWDTSDIPAGHYVFKTEIISGASPSGGVREFYICTRPAKSGRTVAVTGMSEKEQATLISLGYTPKPIEDGDTLIIAGAVTDDNLGILSAKINAGATVIALKAATDGDKSLELIPEDRRPTPVGDYDWVYHRETVLRPRGRYFAGLKTGLADALLYTDVTAPMGLEGPAPDQTDAFVFETGAPGEKRFFGGYAISSYSIGNGKLVINTLRLIESADTAPSAARMLVNMIEAESEKSN